MPIANRRHSRLTICATLASLPIIPNRLHGAAIEGVGTLGHLCGSRGLALDEREACAVVTTKDGWSDLAAPVKVDAVVVDVEGTGNTASDFVLGIRHGGMAD